MYVIKCDWSNCTCLMMENGVTFPNDWLWLSLSLSLRTFSVSTVEIAFQIPLWKLCNESHLFYSSWSSHRIRISSGKCCEFYVSFTTSEYFVVSNQICKHFPDFMHFSPMLQLKALQKCLANLIAFTFKIACFCILPDNFIVSISIVYYSHSVLWLFYWSDNTRRG